MENSQTLPSRFSTEAAPTDGIITITDTKTGRATQVGLTTYPKFVQSLNELFDFSEEDSSSEDVSKAPPSAETADVAPVAEDPAAQEKPKRGRPKKVAAETSSVPEFAVETPTSEPTVEAEPTKPKRRGRPKKAAAEVTETPEEVVAEPKAAGATAVEESAKPKRRGRPKKAAAEAELPLEQVQTTAPDAEETAPKPKRGRPKKDAASADTSTSAEAKPAAVKAEPQKRAPRKAPAKAAKAPETAPVTAESIEGKGYVLVPQSNDEFPLYDIIATSGDNLGTVQQDPKSKRVYVKPIDEKKFKPTDHTSFPAAKARVFVIAR